MKPILKPIIPLSSSRMIPNPTNTCPRRHRHHHHHHHHHHHRSFQLHLQPAQPNNENQHQKHQNKATRTKMTTINSLDQFLEFLAEDERIVVIKYYASWCKSCHKFGVKYNQLAHEHADQIQIMDDDDNSNSNENENKNMDSKKEIVVSKGKVRFAQIEYGANMRLCRTFNIKKLPYIQIYKAPVGKLSEFVCGPKFFEERLTSRLDHYLTCNDDQLKFERDLDEGEVLVKDTLMEEVEKKNLSMGDIHSSESKNANKVD